MIDDLPDLEKNVPDDVIGVCSWVCQWLVAIIFFNNFGIKSYSK